jgi:CRISPR-associated exonuclease Cas4
VTPSFVSDEGWLTVGDLKQAVYCPRIPYFLRTLGLKPPSTFLMKRGEYQERVFTERQKRHQVTRFRLPLGVRHPHVVVRSGSLRLSGAIDLVIEGDDELVVVDFKAGRDAMWDNHRIQLAAYALMAEERFHRPCLRGYVLYRERRHWVEVEVSDALRKRTLDLLQQLREATDCGLFPDPTQVVGRCRNCEFLNFCGDRW